jgi:G3E family GTPase
LQAGRYELRLQEGPDPAMQVALLPAAAATAETLATVQEQAVLVFSDEEQPLENGGTLHPGETLVRLNLWEPAPRFSLDIPEPGSYALFTEHHPDEFAAVLCRDDAPVAPVLTHAYKPDHEHDEEVASVGIALEGDLDVERVNTWLSTLLREQGPDIFRMKGILSIKDMPERFVFQGVHMLFDGRPDRPWGTEPRRNALIFIGRNLDRAALTEDFRACLA